jgi:glycosyltransferase involved in cell wall biosynthesis
LQVGGNSEKFVKWIDNAFDIKGALLPNLYPISDEVQMKPVWDGFSTIKIGVFGSPRLQKNFMSAIGAAILIQRELRVNVEIHMNVDVEDINNPVTVAIGQMLQGLEYIKLVKHEWAHWNDFIKIINDMDVLLQPSYTESFNIVTADGISVGVPSVVSSAIYWAPDSWKAETDDCNHIAKTGIRLLTRYSLRCKGITALKKYNRKSVNHWFDFFSRK